MNLRDAPSLTQSARGRAQRRKTRFLACRALTPLLGWTCARGDVIICPEGPPSERFQEHLYQARGFNPQWVTEPAALENNKLGGLQPWGVSPQSVATLETLTPLLIPSASPLPDPLALRALSATFTKAWDLEARREVRRALIESGEPCPWYLPNEEQVFQVSHVDELDEVINTLRESACHRWVIKAAWGNAGRGLLHIDTTRPLSDPEQGWLRRQAAWGLTIEPWLSRRADLSLQGTVDGDTVRYEGAVVNNVDHLGRFSGVLISPPAGSLPIEMKRLLNGDGRDRQRLKRIGRLVTRCVGDLLIARGHQGAFGVDMLIAERSQGGYTLYPLVEVNPRYTMGRVALALRRHLDPQGRLQARLKFYPPKAPRDLLLSSLKHLDTKWDTRGAWTGARIGANDWWRELCVDAHPSSLKHGQGPVAILESNR